MSWRVIAWCCTLSPRSKPASDAQPGIVVLSIQGEKHKVSEEDVDFLASCFAKYGSEASLLNVSELHGFLTALVLCPEEVDPPEWLGVLWGEQEAQPEWETKDEFERWYAIIGQIKDVIYEQICQGPEYFNPLFAELCGDADKAGLDDSDSISIYWRIGFARCTALRPGLWAQVPEPFYDQLRLICEPVSEDCLKDLKDSDIDERFSRDGWEIILAVFSLYNYWAMITQMPDDDDTPCHCGSNLSYFRCCGLN